MRYLPGQPPRSESTELQNYLSAVYREIQALEVAIPKTEIRTINLDTRGVTISVPNGIGAVLLNSDGQLLTVTVRNDNMTFTGVTQVGANVLIYRR